jgi:uncharacterized coiled-coil DUF342 family protein
MKETMILTPTSPGELIDKITVLQIKKERIQNPERLSNVVRELTMLEETRGKYFPKDSEVLKKVAELEASLKKSNIEIWDMSEKIRELMDAKSFNQDFIETSFHIHLSNDKRATTKKEINLLLGSSIIEEKSYKHWK